MPTEVDNRVVQMTFNNKSFEKGVEQTLSTLDKLKKALKFDNASKGFEEIQRAADGTDLSRIAASVSSLSDRFSALGIVGMQVWTRIGNAAIDMVTGPFKKAEQMVSNTISSITNQIESGGWARALNIDKAKNMILNLDYAWDAVSGEEYAVNRKGEEMANIYYSVNKAVDGTAYSLDEAAVASANFLAAGVDGGEELTDTLRAAMGVASTYSKDFNQVANYFQKVATAGVVTQSVLSDMQMVGIESSSVLKEYLGLTQEELEEAIKDRLITFDQFRDAYLDKFGDSLDKANDTYEGALSNMKSAMSRIGAVIAQPLVDELIPAMNIARLAFNAINKALKATIFEDIVDLIQNAGKALRDIFAITDETGKVIGLSKTSEKIIHQITIGLYGIQTLFKSLKSIVEIFAKAFRNVFLKDTKEGNSIMQKFAYAMLDFKASVEKNKDKILNFFESVLYLLKLAGTVIKPVITIAAKLLVVALKIAAVLVTFVGNLTKAIVESKTFKTILDVIKKVVTTFKTVIEKTVKSLITFIDKTQLFNKVAKIAKTTWEALGAVIEFLWTILSLAVSSLSDAITAFIDKYDPLNKVLNGIKIGVEFVTGAVKDLIEQFLAWLGIDFKFPSMEDFNDTLESVKSAFVSFFNDPKGAAEELWSYLEEFGTWLSEGFSSLVGKAGDALNGIWSALVNIKNNSSGAKEKLGEFSSDDEGFENLEKRSGILGTISKALDNFANALSAFWGVIKTIGAALIGGLKDAYNAIKEFFDIDDVGDVISLLWQGIAMLASVEFINAVSSVLDVVDLINERFGHTPKTVLILNSLSKLIRNFALAFISIAFAMAEMTRVDQGKLASVAAVVEQLSAIMAGLAAALMVLYSKLNLADKGGTASAETIAAKLKGKAQVTISKGLRALASRLGTAAELLAVGKMLEDIAQSLAYVSATLVGLYVVFNDPESGFQWDKFKDCLAGLTLVAVIMASLTFVIFKIVDSAEGLGSKLGNSAELVSVGTMMIMFAGAIAGIVAAISVLTALAAINPEAVEKAASIMNRLIIWLGLSIALISAAIGLSTKGGGAGQAAPVAAIALVIQAVVGAILIFAGAIVALAIINPDNMWSAVGVLAICLGALAVVIFISEKFAEKADAKNLTSVAGIILMMAIFIGVALNGITKIGEAGVTFDDVIGPILALLLVMGVLAGITAWLKGEAGSGGADDALKVFAGLALAIASLYVIALTIEKFQSLNLDLDEFMSYLIAITLVMALVGGFAAVMDKYVGGVDFALIGTGFLAIGAGIFLLCAGIALLLKICENLDTTNLETTFKEVGYAIAAGLLGFFTAFIDGFATECGNILSLLGEILITLIVGIIDFVAEHAVEIGAAVGRLIAALVIIIVAAVVQLFVDLIAAICDCLGIASPSKVFADIGEYILQGFINGIEGMLEFLWKCVSGLIEAFLKFFTDIFSDILQIGADIISNLAEGIEGALETVKEAADTIVKGVVGVFEGIYSQVREIGDRVVESIFGDIEDVNAKLDEADAARAAQREDVDDYFQTNKLGGLQSLTYITEEYNKELANTQDALKELRRLEAMGTSKQSVEWMNASREYSTAYENMAKWKKKILQLAVEAENYGESQGYETGMGFQFTWGGTDYRSVSALWKGMGNAAAEGFESGLDEYLSSSQKKTYAWMEANAQAARDALGIASPSKVFKRIGFFTVEGFNIALEDGFKSSAEIVMNSMNDLSDTASKYDMTPVIDTTEVQNKARLTADIFRHAGLNMSADVELMNKTNTSKIDNLSGAVTNLTAATDNATVNSRLDAQNALINKILDKFDTMGVYLDSGAMVGGISSKMDKALGFRAGQVSRGVR